MNFKEFASNHNYDLRNAMLAFVMQEEGSMAKDLFKKLNNAINESKTSPVTDMQVINTLLEKEVDSAIKHMPDLHKSYKEEDWHDKGALVAFLMIGIHLNFMSSIRQYSRLLEECVDNVDAVLQKQMVTLWKKDASFVEEKISSIVEKITEKLESKNG